MTKYNSLSSILYQEDTHHRILIQYLGSLFRPVILQHFNQSHFVQLCSENICSEFKKK